MMYEHDYGVQLQSDILWESPYPQGDSSVTKPVTKYELPDF